MEARSLVYYLGKVQPETLETLRREHPREERLFSAEMQFGDAPADSQAAKSSDRAARFALISASLAQIRSDLDSVALLVKGRMLAARRVRLWGGVVAALSGAVGAFAVLLGKQWGWMAEGVAFGGAAVSSVGGLLTVFADHVERAPSGKRLSGPEDLSDLLEARAEVEKISLRVNRNAVVPMEDGEILAAITTLDEAALRLLRFKYVAT